MKWSRAFAIFKDGYFLTTLLQMILFFDKCAQSHKFTYFNIFMSFSHIFSPYMNYKHNQSNKHVSSVHENYIPNSVIYKRLLPCILCKINEEMFSQHIFQQYSVHWKLLWMCNINIYSHFITFICCQFTIILFLIRIIEKSQEHI